MTLTCRNCGQEVHVPITPDQKARVESRFKTGEYIQDILPEISDELREMFISRTCPTCWRLIFPEEED